MSDVHDEASSVASTAASNSSNSGGTTQMEMGGVPAELLQTMQTQMLGSIDQMVNRVQTHLTRLEQRVATAERGVSVARRLKEQREGKYSSADGVGVDVTAGGTFGAASIDSSDPEAKLRALHAKMDGLVTRLTDVEAEAKSLSPKKDAQ